MVRDELDFLIDRARIGQIGWWRSRGGEGERSGETPDRAHRASLSCTTRSTGALGFQQGK